MANPFDQFDAPKAKTGGNPFDQFDGPSAPVPKKKQKPKTALDFLADEGTTGTKVRNFGRALGQTLATNPRSVPDSAANMLPNSREVGRTGMQMIGATAGGILGSGAGPGGTVGGGALGYAIGNKLADLAYQNRPAPEITNSPMANQLLQSGGDVGVGLAYEGMGAGVNAAGRGAGNAVDLYRGVKAAGGAKQAVGNWLSKRAEAQAGNRLLSAASDNPTIAAQVARNRAANEEVEKAIPGLKFNVGQQGGDPNLLSLARQQGQKPGAGTAFSNESVMAQNKAISDYISDSIRGKGDVSDWLGSLQKEQSAMEAQTAAANRAAETKAAGVQGANAQDTGATIRERATAGRSASSKKAGALFDSVPENLKISPKPLYDKVKELFGGFNALTQRLSATPTGTMGRVSEAMEPPPSAILGPNGKPIVQETPAEMTFKQLQDFRSQVKQGARKAYAAGDYELGWKYDQLGNAVSETFEQAAKNGQGEGVSKLKAATDYWRDVHIPSYRQGATGKVLKNTSNGEQRVIESAVGGEYFNSGKGAAEAADSFNRTFGNDPEAKEAIRDYAAQSLLKESRNPVTGELDRKRVAAWLYQHNTALDKLGLKSEFGGLSQALQQAEKAKGEELAFNKSSLAKALEVDPDKAISQALMTGAGKKQSIARLFELTRIAKKSGQPAVSGLKAAIGDYFQQQTLNTTRDLAGNKLESLAKIDRFMKDYFPAIEQSGLYSKAELNAFRNVHKSVAAIAKQASPHPGFSNSATAELMARAADKGASVTFGKVYHFAKGFYNLLDKPIQAEVDAALARAVFDPRYADVVTRLAQNAKTKVPVDKAIKAFHQSLATLGGIASLSQYINPSTQQEQPNAEDTQP